MIESIKHKGLRNFAENGDTSGIQHNFIPKVRAILTLLQSAKSKLDFDNVKSLNFHELKGDMRGTYSLKVNKNYRITFKLNESNMGASDIDLEDYH